MDVNRRPVKATEVIKGGYSERSNFIKDQSCKWVGKKKKRPGGPGLYVFS
jgi:hypothetical protein